MRQRYPPIEAEGDEQLEDGLFTRRIAVAEQIVKDTLAFGRRRVQKTSEANALDDRQDAFPPG